MSLTGCGEEKSAADINKDVCKLLIEQVVDPGISSIGGEWTVIGTARSGEEVPEGYYENYYDNVRATVKSSKGVLDESRYTEYARVSIALAAIGEDPTDVEGYDIMKPLDDYDAVTGQGINGSAYALIASKVNNYTLKNEGKYIEHILSQELESGGFSYNESDKQASADMTAIAMQALVLYPQNAEASAAVERAVDVLADIQQDDGTFVEEGFDPSSESVSQVIVALVSAGIDPVEDERFIKDGKTLYDVLMDYYCDNGFCHVIGDGGNMLATEQAVLALDALTLAEEGSSLYEF